MLSAHKFSWGYTYPLPRHLRIYLNFMLPLDEVGKGYSAYSFEVTKTAFLQSRRGFEDVKSYNVPFTVLTELGKVF